ncbi:bifunctional P-loop containing nucleoside triphosphate hydrolase/ATPase [Babesia duncani]|uniref:Bifunctional P-loop containing nucleoside triphosphate hydrolase/ATPase n=1 Tax=Babesia duncani TaxID=323732 RepID=A0AAD9PKN6_9APIC|nr:bifunctional P-loop containing nucleoside triphosphate hydrolase/ATPase [Babesia duncani]
MHVRPIPLNKNVIEARHLDKYKWNLHTQSGVINQESRSNKTAEIYCQGRKYAKFVTMCTFLTLFKALAITDNVQGPPGIGKTTSVLCLAKEILGPQYKNGVLELNASDDRGIDVVRENIKNFAKKSLVLPPNKHKIIILDEADSMTEAAQQVALRRIMEMYSNTTRFALACNQSTKIIEAIQSRCAVIRYTKLKAEWILQRLMDICKIENVEYTQDGMETLLFTADGDLRRAVNNLQNVSSGFQLVTKENVLKVCDVPSPDAIRKILQSCLNAQWREAHEKAYQLLDSGHSPLDILGLIICSLITQTVALAHMTMVGGLGTILQLEKLLASLCKISVIMRNT